MLTRAIRNAKALAAFEKVPFGTLRPFLEALVQCNRGMVKCVTAQDGVFKRAFLAPGMCVASFTHSTRVVGLDACHIKAYYGGVLLVMTILYGNGQVFPRAVAIAESENPETWTWFLSNVKTAFPVDNGHGLVVLSDREKGIDAAVTRLFPQASHSYCVYHIQKNVKVNFHTSLGGLLFTAARAESDRVFNDVIEEIKRMHARAGEFVSQIKKEKWARAFFPSRRFGHVTSNISESMNWWLEKARHLEPVGLFSVYIRKLNGIFERRRQRYQSMLPHELPPNVSKTLAKAIERGRTLRLVKHTSSVYEVERQEHLPFRVVDLDARTCTRGFPQEHGIPCRHVCRVLMQEKVHPKHFVIPERRVEALKATYLGVTYPVDTSLLQNDGLKAPTQTKRRGRPKKLRIHSSAEKAPRGTVRCGRCGERGHNKRTCTKG